MTQKDWHMTGSTSVSTSLTTMPRMCSPWARMGRTAQLSPMDTVREPSLSTPAMGKATYLPKYIRRRGALTVLWSSKYINELLCPPCIPLSAQLPVLDWLGLPSQDWEGHIGWKFPHRNHQQRSYNTQWSFSGLWRKDALLGWCLNVCFLIYTILQQITYCSHFLTTLSSLPEKRLSAALLTVRTAKWSSRGSSIRTLWLSSNRTSSGPTGLRELCLGLRRMMALASQW